MKELLNDYIFTSFLTSGMPENLNNLLILRECYEARENEPQGVHKSNANANGWHSEVYNKGMTEFENLNKLYAEVLNFGNTVLEAHGLKQTVKKVEWWININPEHSYNVMHSHPKTDLSVVYYAKVNEQAGNLVLMRNDGATHLDLYTNMPEQLRFTIHPVVGRLYAFPAHLLHYVQSNGSDADRVSVAFNLTV